MTSKELTDEELLPSLQQKEQWAFQVLVERYHRQMVIVARSLVGNAFADEVTQDAWIAIHRSIDKFEGRSALKTWLFTIVSNRAKTRLKRESRHVSFDPQETQDQYSSSRFSSEGSWTNPPSEWDINSPEKLLEESELQRCIEKTLEIVPAMQKSVFLLRDMNQHSLDEICNILSLTDSNVRVLLHRARQRLLAVVDHYQETGEC